MRLFLEIYFGANLIFASYWLGDNHGWSGNNNLKLAAGFIGRVLASIPWHLLVFIWVVLGIMLKPVVLWLDSKTMIPFRVALFFGKWDNLDPLVLQTLNRRLKINEDKKGTEPYERWEKVIEVINKRNNYTPAL